MIFRHGTEAKREVEINFIKNMLDFVQFSIQVFSQSQPLVMGNKTGKDTCIVIQLVSVSYISETNQS